MALAKTLVESQALGLTAPSKNTYYVKGLVNDGSRMLMTGTDNTAALQAEINNALYVVKSGRISLPAGVFLISDTIHLGYGVNSSVDGSPYVSFILEGAATSTVNTGSAGTTLVWAGPKDRPMFAMSGCMKCQIRSMALIGGSAYVASTHLGSDYINKSGLEASWNVANSYTASVWTDPRISVAGTGTGTSGALDGVTAGAGTGASITAPWCAIAVDPYTSTSTPSPAYPNATFPTGILAASFYSSPYQYSKAASSDNAFVDLTISGFYVGIVVAPTGATIQSDFCRFNRLWIQNCVYGISVNGSNPRENSLTDSYINQCHTAISTGLHCTPGNGSAGQWGAAIINTAFDRNIKWHNFNAVGAQYTGNVTFLNCYSENSYSLGNFGKTYAGSASDDNNIVYQTCFVSFNHQGVRGVPAKIIEVSDNACCSLIGGSYDQYVGAFSLSCYPSHLALTGGVRFKKYGSPTALYEKIADNGTGGGVVCRASGGNSFGDYFSKYVGYNTSGASTEVFSQNTQATSAVRPGSWYAHNFYGSKLPTKVTNPRLGYQVAVTAGFNQGAVLNGRILTLTWTSGWQSSNQDLVFRAVGVGDAFMEQSTGYVFYIYNVTSTVITALMMTGWALNPSVVIGGSGGNGTVGSYTMTGNNFVPQTVTVTFSSATTFSVTGSIQGAMGSGTVDNAFSGTGGLGFTIKQGSTLFSAGSTITITIAYSYANGWAPDATYVTCHMHCRMFSPATYVVGTATSGNASVTACADDSGSNTNVAAALPPTSASPAGVQGVVLYTEASSDYTFNNCGLITANASGTLTLSGNAAKSGTRQLGLAAVLLSNAANP